MTDATHTERFNDPQGRTATSSQAVVASSSPALLILARTLRRPTHGRGSRTIHGRRTVAFQIRQGACRPSMRNMAQRRLALVQQGRCGDLCKDAKSTGRRFQSSPLRSLDSFYHTRRVQAANEASRPERQYGRWPFSGRGQVCACPRHSLANAPDVI